jgi:hypothetical protein
MKVILANAGQRKVEQRTVRRCAAKQTKGYQNDSAS